MKAAVCHEYGPPDVLKVEEVPKPTPRDDEVSIQVLAASVNLGDWELLTGDPLYIDRCYPLSEAGEALRRVGEKRSKGKVIITP